jgi:hypothetical protein
VLEQGCGGGQKCRHGPSPNSFDTSTGLLVYICLRITV